MITKNRYRTIAGFSIILIMITSAWFGKNIFLSTFIAPLILGAFQFINLINSVPQIIWWIFVIIVSCSLIIIKTAMPTLDFKGRKEKEDEVRLFELDKLIKDSLGSSKYTGQQLSFLLINLHLRNIGEEEIPIGEVENLIKKKTLPEELQNFAGSFYYEGRNRRKLKVQRSALERAVHYLNNTIKGDRN